MPSHLVCALLGLVVAAAAWLPACGGAVTLPDPGTQTYVNPVDPNGVVLPDVPLPGTAAGPSRSGLSVAALQNTTLCVGNDAQGLVKLTPCSGSFLTRFNLQGGRWRAGDGRCLDLNRSATAAGTALLLSSCSDTNATQRWSLDNKGYLFFAPASGAPTLCVFAGVASAQNATLPATVVSGAQLALGKCSDKALQWQVAPEGMSLSYDVDRSGCLQAGDSSLSAGDPAVIAPCDGSARQLWTLVGNQLRLRRATTLCLDINRNVDPGGSQLDLWTCNGGSAQLFTLVGSDSSLRLQSRPTLCVQPGPGGVLQVDTCSSATRWTLAPP